MSSRYRSQHGAYQHRSSRGKTHSLAEANMSVPVPPIIASHQTMSMPPRAGILAKNGKKTDRYRNSWLFRSPDEETSDTTLRGFRALALFFACSRFVGLFSINASRLACVCVSVCLSVCLALCGRCNVHVVWCGVRGREEEKKAE